MKSIKSMINPTGTPEVNPDDAIGLKIVELSTKVQEMRQVQERQTIELAEVNVLLNELFKDIEALRNPHGQTSGSDPGSSETPEDEQK